MFTRVVELTPKSGKAHEVQTRSMKRSCQSDANKRASDETVLISDSESTGIL
jgi:hypothetical protein